MARRNTVELDALLDGVRRRAPESFRALYEITANGLNSFAYSMLRDRGSAEDAVQQAFLELVNAAPGIKGDGRSLRAWLYQSVRFRCLDEIRRRSRRGEALVADPPESGQAPDEVLTLALDPELEAALRDLTDQQRSVILLRHVVGLSGAEVAEVLGSTRAAVFATAARAERRLRSLLDPDRRHTAEQEVPGEARP